MISQSKEIFNSPTPVRFGIVAGEARVVEGRQEIRAMIEEYMGNGFDPSKGPTEYLPIQAGRALYRSLKKDPTRYRLSSEALMRRVKKERDVYEINDLVDLMNLYSLQTGYPVGLYDLDKIKGDILFRPGLKDEEYRGLGKGVLNIENLPVLSDDLGAFGSATSDSERTAITSDTHAFLLVIFGFGESDLHEQVVKAREMMTEFLDVKIEKGGIIDAICIGEG